MNKFYTLQSYGSLSSYSVTTLFIYTKVLTACTAMQNTTDVEDSQATAMQDP